MKPHVVVAHDAEAIRGAICRLLEDAGYRVTALTDGEETLEFLKDEAAAPRAVVLDVGIQKVFAFEVVDHLRAKSMPTRVLLVASIYNRTGYKRAPVSLHGADDYVEQHHIPDQLLPRLNKLIGVSEPDAGAVNDAVVREEEPIRKAGRARLQMRYDSPEEGVERARRLAHLIVADIAFYNDDLLQLPDDAERQARLREDMEEGRLLFELRVAKEIRDTADFIGDALEDWLEKDAHGPAGETAFTPAARRVSEEEEDRR